MALTCALAITPRGPVFKVEDQAENRVPDSRDKQLDTQRRKSLHVVG